jgi:two-component system, CitB family, response regulator DctR
MSEFRVLVVEDDELVAKVYRRVLDETPGFRVVSVAPTAEYALRVLRQGVSVDLMLLDIGLPGADGTSLLRAIRRDEGPEVIAVTAMRDKAVVKTLLHMGVVDYLIKPFTFERLQHALMRFRSRDRALSSESVNQNELDTFYGAADKLLLPRGLSHETLNSVRKAMMDLDEPASANQVAKQAFVARVTARRYLEYLATLRQVQCITEVDGPGRPRKTYRWLGVTG